MDFRTPSDAAIEKLTRLTAWMDDSADNRRYIEVTIMQVMRTPGRITMPVKGKDERIALFVDEQGTRYGELKTSATRKGPSVRTPSKTGKYQSIRQLVEVLFANDPNTTLDKFKAEMNKEYPHSGPAGIRCYGHWCWYRHHLVKQGRFKCIPVPEWFKK